MSCSSFLSTAFPPPPSSTVPKHRISLRIIANSTPKTNCLNQNKATTTTGPLTLSTNPDQNASPKSAADKFSLLLLHCGAVIATTPGAALAVTGENNGEEDLMSTLIGIGIVAVLYLFVVPPILMNWMRLRWFKRRFLEMYLQFMCVFIFFPGLLLWAPFINFRKFPRDPTMEYPWSTPKDDVPLYKSR